MGIERRDVTMIPYMHARRVGGRGGGRGKVSRCVYVTMHLPLSSATPSAFISAYWSSLDDFLPKVRDNCFLSLLTDDVPAI